MLEVRQFSFRYSGHTEYAIRNLTFQCELDGVTAIVGRSCIGKSTFIAAVAGVYRPGDAPVGEFTGDIRVDNEAPSKLEGPAVVSWVPQASVLLDHLTILENILLPSTLLNAGAQGAKVLKDSAEKLLSELNLLPCSGSRPRELSGGMRSRVSLLRALITEPKYLF